MRCSHCGASVADGHTYCTTCGMKLTAESRPVHPATPPSVQPNPPTTVSPPAEPAQTTPPAAPAYAPVPAEPAHRQNGLELSRKEGIIGALLVAVEAWAFGWLWAALGALAMFKFLRDKKEKEGVVPTRYYVGLILITALIEFLCSVLIALLL